MSMVVDGLKAFWDVFAAMSPWLLVGFLIAGMIAVWLPRPLVMKVMGSHLGLRGVLRAVLIGVPLPICSCGVIPIATALRKAGAGKGPTAGFLIATPQTGIDSILATYALLGPFFAIARPVAAFLTGIIGGGAVHAVAGEDEPKVSACGCCQGVSEKPDRGLKAVLWQGYVRILAGVVKPLFIGLVISAAVTVLLPDGFFADSLKGHEWLQLFLMAVLGFPMYVCSTAAIPIAAALVMKGLSPGAAFVFLMTGPAVNAMSIAAISTLIGRRAAIAYVAVIIAGAVLAGALVNLLPDALPAGFSALALQERAPSAVNHISGGVLALIMSNAFLHPPKMR